MDVEPHPGRHSPLPYFVVFAALILLTASTVAASLVDLGEWHTPVGLLIAATKATLIVLFFMHGLESGRLVWMVLAVALLFFAIMYALTFADFATRGMDDGIRDPGGRAALTVPAPRRP